MADPQGFLQVVKVEATKRPVDERVGDWREVYEQQDPHQRAGEVSQQARRCMDCGIPFCHSGTAGCPLGNLIPEWNDLVRRGRWDAASDRLHATNNFPEFTGRLCPAPCEAACVLSIGEEQTGGSVTIKRIEQIDRRRGLDGRHRRTAAGGHLDRSATSPSSAPARRDWLRHSSSPAPAITSRSTSATTDSAGCCATASPSTSWRRPTLNQRLTQMRAEGTRFVTDCEVGVDLSVDELRNRFDAVVLAVGALRARRQRRGGPPPATVCTWRWNTWCRPTRSARATVRRTISAAGRHVVIIGGGDTGADCLGTAHRQGAASVTQLDYNPEPPEARDDSLSPWPTWPLVLRTSPAHAEGGRRRYEVAVQRFIGDEDGNLRAMEIAEVSVMRDPQTGRRTHHAGR